MFVKLLTVFASIAPVLGGALIPEWVQRRQSGDIYNYVNENVSHKHCDNTYLVDDNQCVMDQELFEGCSHPIIPVQSPHLLSLALPVTTPNNIYYLAVDVYSKQKFNGVGFHFNETDLVVNSSFCRVSSLEVYRGRKQVTGISHQGFSLTDSGAVEINRAQLAYDWEEYVGELFRINLFCSNGSLLINGCLFFKVPGERNYVTNVPSPIIAKFNCTVPGTLSVKLNEYTQMRMNVTSTVTATIHSADDNTVTSDLAGVAVLAYVLIAIGGCLSLSIILVCMCIIIGFWGNKHFCATTAKAASKSKSSNTECHNLEVISEQWQHNQKENLQAVSISPSRCIKNPAYIHLGPEIETHQTTPPVISDVNTHTRNPAAIQEQFCQISCKCNKNPA